MSSSGLGPQLVESMTHLPGGMEHPVQALGSMAVVGLAIVAQRAAFDRSEEGFAVHFPNPALLEKSHTPDSDVMAKRRLGPLRSIFIGTGLVGVQLLGEPVYDVTLPDSEAKAIVVVDASTSMLLTKDLGNAETSRSVATKNSLERIKFDGNLAVIQTAAKTEVAIPLGKDWLAQKAKMGEQLVDPNGGSVGAALELAASLLPKDKKNPEHSGTVVLISDGTTDDTEKNLLPIAKKLDKAGVDVKVIVPGNKDATYVLDGVNKPVKSGASADKFEVFGKKNVTEAKDTASLDKAIDGFIHDANLKTEHRPWHLPGVVGSILGLTGLARIIKRDTTRK